MPYADAERQREAVKSWHEAHPEKVKAYKRTSLLRKSVRERRLPRASSVEHHAFTEEELMRIVASVLHKESCGWSRKGAKPFSDVEAGDGLRPR